MALCWEGGKALSEPMMAYFTDAYMYDLAWDMDWIYPKDHMRE